MLEKHIQRNGEQSLIAEMADSHLLNTIKLYSRKLLSLRSFAYQEQQAIDEFTMSVYDIPKMSPADAAKEYKGLLRQLYPYMAEAFLRGLAPPQNLIQAVGRNSQLTFEYQLPAQLSIEANEEDDINF
jgi:hypothetical protein